MPPVDTLLEARWVVPVEPHGAVLEDHAVALAGATIAEVLPIEAAREKYTNVPRIALPAHALIPGLVNAHTHNPMTLMRGLADDLPLMTWLEQHIWPAEARAVGAEFVRDGVELAIAEMLRGGTTCCNENYFFPDVQAATYLQHGFRAVVGLPFIEFPSAWAKSRDEYFAKNLAVHDEFKGESLIATALAPHAPYTVADESFHRIRVLADQLDVAVHMTQLTDGEIAELAEAGASVVHCPESNLKLASGFCPAEKLRRAGVNLALGTDGCASNNDLDMFGEMRTAALLAKGVAGDASAFDAAAVLRAATLNGARALGLADRIGSIVPGKQADLVAVRLDALETQPVSKGISQLVYATGRHQVSDVWIAGVRKVENGALLGIDATALRATAETWRERMAENA